MKTKDYNDFSYFNTWILGYLDIGKSSFGWYYHLNKRNPDNDENAFKEFFEFLERFKIDTLIETRIKVKSLLKDDVQFELKKLKFRSSKTIWVESVNSDVYSYNSWFCHEEEFLKEIKNNFEIIILV